MQHFLKATSGAARAGIVPAKFLDKFLPAVDDAETSLDVSFGREPLATFAAGFVEKSCYSRQSLLPDGFARHITESEPLIDSTLFFHSEIPSSDNPVYQDLGQVGHKSCHPSVFGHSPDETILVRSEEEFLL